MTNTKLLQLALKIANEAHQDQLDKASEPYIEHVLRVSHQGDNQNERVVGLLHDVVEDSDYTIMHLATAGFPDNIILAVDAITKRAGESYDDYISRVKNNEIARKVKLYDLTDNLDLKRLKSIKEKDLYRINKYLASYSFLNAL